MGLDGKTDGKGVGGTGVEDEGDDEAVQPEHLGKDQYQHGRDELSPSGSEERTKEDRKGTDDTGLVNEGADGVVADDADGHAGRKTCQTGRQSSCQVNGPRVERVGLGGVECAADQYCDDEAVDLWRRVEGEGRVRGW